MNLPPPASMHGSGWPWSDQATPSSSPPGEWPRITIITPSFNQGSFIEETIRSVLLQGYPNLEYIIIDGGSTDGTVEIIKKYAPWIAYWVSERDRGQSHAINKGLARASGEWFNWLNSDDVFAPGALFALVGAATGGAQGRVAASGVTANLRGSTVFSRYSARVSPAWPDALFSMRVNQPGSLLHLPSVRDCGGVRDDLRLVMDLDLWLRLIRRHGPSAFVQIDAEVAIYRYHEQSKTCAGEDVFALEEFALLVDLAASVPGLEIAPAILALRAHCTAAPRTTDGLPLEAKAAERAWLDRLVVSDSLLFRALRQTLPANARTVTAFVSLLDELMPALQRHHTPPDARRTQARAIVHAMQIERRITWSAGCRVLRLSPSLASVRALARLVFVR